MRVGKRPVRALHREPHVAHEIAEAVAEAPGKARFASPRVSSTAPVGGAMPRLRCPPRESSRRIPRCAPRDPRRRTQGTRAVSRLRSASLHHVVGDAVDPAGLTRDRIPGSTSCSKVERTASPWKTTAASSMIGPPGKETGGFDVECDKYRFTAHPSAFPVSTPQEGACRCSCTHPSKALRSAANAS